MDAHSGSGTVSPHFPTHPLVSNGVELKWTEISTFQIHARYCNIIK